MLKGKYFLLVVTHELRLWNYLPLRKYREPNTVALEVKLFVFLLTVTECQDSSLMQPLPNDVGLDFLFFVHGVPMKEAHRPIVPCWSRLMAALK